MLNVRSIDNVIALPPNGLKNAYSRTINKAGGVVVAIIAAGADFIFADIGRLLDAWREAKSVGDPA